MSTLLEDLASHDFLAPIDLHFARFVSRIDGGNEAVALAAALASKRRREGHVCLDLPSVAGKPLRSETDEAETLGVCPDLATWRAALSRSEVVGEPGQYTPLVFDGESRLYLYRYWDYETRLARELLARAARPSESLDLELLEAGLDRLFGTPRKGETDWQRRAAFTAVTRRVCVVSGGPGTGKTTTVAKILVLLLEQSAREPLRIALTAPTGKAAARLEESIRACREHLDCPEEIRSRLPADASTLHRLLGWRQDSAEFLHHGERKLPADVIVVDEASMVDLALMTKLVDALGKDARLILLGDRDQLASVEAGAVLGDICGDGVAEQIGGLGKCVVLLRKNYRFKGDGGIEAVSRAVRLGHGEEALELLKSGTYPDVLWRETKEPDDLVSVLAARRELAAHLGRDSAAEAFESFNRFRILCALRRGPFGVTQINDRVEQLLHKAGRIDAGRSWYAGRPVLVTRNDYQLELYNGDVGLTLEDPETGRSRVYFQSEHGQCRSFLPQRLPPCQTTYAMTIHKSQGSEFDTVLVVLPPRLGPVLTRELIYTAISRARSKVEVVGTEETFLAAVARRVERTSGLRDALWKAEKKFVQGTLDLR